MDMSNYKMIYNDQVFNVVSIMPTMGLRDEHNRSCEIKTIEAIFIDENGELGVVDDEAWCFKFVRR